MEENGTLVFRGFLNLTNLEKLRLTEEINNYLDSINREPIRAENERVFSEQTDKMSGKTCFCGGVKQQKSRPNLLIQTAFVS